MELNGQTHPNIEMDESSSNEHRTLNGGKLIKAIEIFNHYDRNQNGYLDIREIKALIRNQQCDQMPANAARKILKLHDTNRDGRLDFEEFYGLYLVQPSLFNAFWAAYARALVPRPRPSEYERNFKLGQPPLTMVVFSILQIASFLTDHYYLEMHPDVKYISAPGSLLFAYCPFWRPEAWRFFTYILVHDGPTHLTKNLIIQLFLGVALEWNHSWWRISLIYVSGVAAGSMGTSIFKPNAMLVGASGGVFALITAHIATIILNYSEMDFAVEQFLCLLVFCVSNLYEDRNVCHFFGAMAGLLVGICVLRNLKVHRWEDWLRWIALTIFLSLMYIGVCWHIFDARRFPAQSFSWNCVAENKNDNIFNQ